VLDTCLVRVAVLTVCVILPRCCATVHIYRCALSAFNLHTILAAIAFTTATATKLFELLRALLAKIFQVNLHDLLHQVFDLCLVLNDFSDVDNLFSLQKVQEVS